MWITIPQRRGSSVEVGVLADDIQRVGSDDPVRHRALLLVLVEEPGERDAPDPHVGVLRLVLELRTLGRPAQEEHLEPHVLDPAQVGDDTGHRHQG